MKITHCYCVNGNEIHDRLANYDATGARTGNTPNLIAKVEYPYGDGSGQAAYARLFAAAPTLLAICLEIANDSRVDLVDSERRLRLYHAITAAGALDQLGGKGGS